MRYPVVVHIEIDYRASTMLLQCYGLSDIEYQMF